MSFLKYALLNPSFNISYVLYIVLALNKLHTISISAPLSRLFAMPLQELLWLPPV